MKTYEQGKAELDAELNKLKQAMKDAKQNITYDFYCPSCEKIKKIRPSAAFSSDFIISYPGETDDDFKETLNLVKKIKFIIILDLYFTFQFNIYLIY